MTTLLNIKVSPKAKISKIIGWHAGALKIAISAVPEDGAANKELLRILCTSLHLRANEVRLVRGYSSKLKVVEVNMEAAQLLFLLEQIFHSGTLL